MVDLDAYFERIGYRGPREPSLAVLRAVHSLHPAAIPFENLNPLLGWPVALDLPSLAKKLVEDGRGGWCFEQNGLLRHVLETLGFRVTGLGARVLWNAPEGMALSPRSHMVLLVEAEARRYIADVGFGGMTLTSPLLLEPGIEQPTTLEPFRLMPLDEEWVLEARVAAEWKPLYRFRLDPQLPPDYEVSNWYLCHHPSSFFRTTLVAARTTEKARLALRNTEFAVHTPSGSEKRTMASAQEIRSLLVDEFRIQVPRDEAVDARLEQFFA